MLKNWDIKNIESFNKSYKKIDWLIDLVTNIRSTKVTLNIPPKIYIDISTVELSPKNSDIINDNIDVFKRIARVSNVSKSKINNNGIKIIVNSETVILYFDQNLDLNEQKKKVLNKVKILSPQY